MQDANYFKCGDCGYEFLSNSKTPACPQCDADKLEKMDVKKLVGFDE